MNFGEKNVGTIDRAVRLIVGIALLAAFALSACGDDPGSSGDAGTDAGPAAECAEGGNWYDPGTGLCWQNPPAEVAKSLVGDVE